MNKLVKNLFALLLGLSLPNCGINLDSGCISCHTDKDMLITVADPIDYPEGTGEA